MNSIWFTVGFCLAGYLAGAVPFGVVVAKCLGTVDPRTAGSRNVGFTNVLRVAGKKAGALTLVGDIGKGWVIGWVASLVLHQEAAVLLAALAVILGHLYSVFLQFNGGKGVATALGAVLGVDLLIGLLLLGIWLSAVGMWRYSSGGALASFSSFPVLAIVLRPSWEFIAFACTVSGLIWLRHKSNVIRLWKGTESQIGQANHPDTVA